MTIPVVTPYGLDPVVTQFLQHVARIYQYEYFRHTLAHHPLCKRPVPIKLTFVELERQALAKLSAFQIRLQLTS
ncbi:hypothetical protein PM082_015953 [Marasmius tenuissimus]|nr:hypothetical protein PM082_015953 [Marasmius tenuissimus]